MQDAGCLFVATPCSFCLPVQEEERREHFSSGHSDKSLRKECLHVGGLLFLELVAIAVGICCSDWPSLGHVLHEVRGRVISAQT